MTRYWFIATQNPQGLKLAFVTFMLAFLVIILGAYTRLTDAGLSCPDWPNCYGYLTAPHTDIQLQNANELYPATPVNVKKAWTEMIHRYFAGSEGILILFLSFSILFSRRAKNFKVIFIACMLIALLAVQIVLGMLTVTEKLKPVIVLSHLLVGLSLLCFLWWAYLELRAFRVTRPPKKLTLSVAPWLWIAFTIVSAQIALGGWVSTHYAGLACVDFPYCNGELMPPLHLYALNTDLITIHMLHRIGAMVTGLYLFFVSLFLLAKNSLRFYGIIILALVGMQMTLGILNIIWLRPIGLALMHHVVAITLILTLIAILAKIYHESRDRSYGSWIT